MTLPNSFTGDLSTTANRAIRDELDGINPTFQKIGGGQRMQKLDKDGNYTGSIAGSVDGTTAAAFEVDSDGTVPALALGSQAAGTGDFTQTFKPATTLTAGNDILTIDTAGVDSEMIVQVAGVLANTITDITTMQHDHSDASNGGLITTGSNLTGTTSGTFEINSDGFGAILDSTGLSQDSTFTFPDAAGPDELAGIAATQTMTNKTLTSPTITGMTATGASTLESCVIGGVTPADASFTTLSSSGTATLADASITGAASVGGILTVTGAINATSIIGSDSSLGITGLAGAGGGTGGHVVITGGAGHTNSVGGTAGAIGGAGAGTGNGGANVVTGGASGAGATGNGGVANITGGAALSTAGDGGAASLVGGVATTTGTGGAVTITSGASAGAGGTAGAVAIDAGSAAGGTAGAVTIGGTNAASVAVGKTAITTTLNGAVKGEAEGHMVHTLVVDVSVAEINAGHTIVTVPAGRQFQLVDLKQVAFGGAVGTATAVTVTGSAVLTTTAIAALTQSNIVLLDHVNVTPGADGAIFTPQTAGTDITVEKTGGAADTATGVRFIVSYLLV